MVEVTLTQVTTEAKEPKACWFPFKKQVGNRRIPVMDFTNKSCDDTIKLKNTKLSKSRSRHLCKKTSIGENLDGQAQFHRNKRSTGTVSTETEIDTSYLFEESGTTNAGSELFSEGTYIEAPTRSSRSLLGCGRNTTADFSYGNNEPAKNSFVDSDSSPTHKTHLTLSKAELRKPSRSSNFRSGGEYNNSYSFNDIFDGGESILAEDEEDHRNINQQFNESNVEKRLSDGLQTNCMAKEFWTDEADLACIQTREKNQEILHQRQIQSATHEVLEEPSIKKPSKRVNENNGCSAKIIRRAKNPLLRFVSQDPEQTKNDEAPFRRILCSGVPFHGGNRSFLCHQKEGNPRQKRQNNNPMIVHGPDEAQNFYVEVEATQEQLNRIRESGDVSEDIDGNLVYARTTSLVDDESAQIESFETRRKPYPLSNGLPSSVHETLVSNNDARKQHDTPHMKLNSSSSRRIRPLRYKHERNGSQPNSMIQGSPRTLRQYENIDRQKKLLSEMVTERALTMRFGNANITNLIGRSSDEHTASDYEQHSLESGHQQKQRQVETIDRGRVRKSFTFRESSTSSLFSPISDSQATDFCYNQFELNQRWDASSRKEAEKSVDLIAHMNTVKGLNLHEAEIGSFRRSDGSSEKMPDDAISPRCDRDSNRGKFSENFWKDDNYDLDSVAFEKYGSEQD